MSNMHKVLEKIKSFRSIVKNELYKVNPELRNISLRDAKRVLIINSPPRSGSSLVYNLLSQGSLFYSLNGEGVPFYKIHGSFGSVHHGFSDASALKMSLENLNDLLEDLLCDCFVKAENNLIFSNRLLREEYFISIILRLVLQWPNIDFLYSDLLDVVKAAFEQYSLKNNEFHLEHFYVDLLKLLVIQYPEINPYYYDIDPRLLKQEFPNAKIPVGPPNNEILIEEPPFVLVAPQKHISQFDLNNKTLLLKTSIDVHRMQLIKELFPNSEIKTVFLMRNPAGTINGLYDGWLHHGFFSHNLESQLQHSEANSLKIEGYSDRNDFGKKWWNFDLPSGWMGYINKSLPEVCGFQWYSSASKIQDMILSQREGFCVIKYENIVRDYNSRLNEFSKIFSLIGSNCQLSLQDMPVVQATSSPQLSRWKTRSDIIDPVLNSDIIKVANYFDYSVDRKDEWL